MCTVSWHASNNSLTLLFNRDEFRTRADAHPPSVQSVNGVACLYPTDPVGQGTWLGVNEHGLIACMLNFYEQDQAVNSPDPSSWVSRGKLLRDVLPSSSLDVLETTLNTSDLSPYRPFHLLGMTQLTAELWTWDGHTLTSIVGDNLNQPITTSSLMPDEVVPYRQKLFKNTVNGAKGYKAFHYHQDPDHLDYSVRMERDETQTVSISQIELTQKAAHFVYDDFLSDLHQTQLPLRHTPDLPIA